MDLAHRIFQEMFDRLSSPPARILTEGGALWRCFGCGAPRCCVLETAHGDRVANHRCAACELEHCRINRPEVAEVLARPVVNAIVGFLRWAAGIDMEVREDG